MVPMFFQRYFVIRQCGLLTDACPVQFTKHDSPLIILSIRSSKHTQEIAMAALTVLQHPLSRTGKLKSIHKPQDTSRCSARTTETLNHISVARKCLMVAKKSH